MTQLHIAPVVMAPAVRAFLLACALLAASAACSPGERPNIIFLMADDLGWADLGAYGNEILYTPRLDRMAAEGMRFTQVYAGASVCGPSRCVLMTGLHGGHCRLRDNLAHRPGRTREERLVPLREEDVTVAELLRERGYATGGVGKWGLGDIGSSGAPSRQGFDSFFG
ncbi:MAG: sulfatase-like hydrolase/transferase, partial [Acidobacteria bacterium]|nr:sulfatase-like hydrolase/transferase [Acidobacteriota bacterium]